MTITWDAEGTQLGKIILGITDTRVSSITMINDNVIVADQREVWMVNAVPGTYKLFMLDSYNQGPSSGSFIIYAAETPSGSAGPGSTQGNNQILFLVLLLIYIL